MVILIPDDRVREEMNNSNAEWELYKRVEKLSDDYFVFHSINLPLKDTNNNYILDKEIDFVIFNPYYGILCIEVKGGHIKGEKNRIWQKTNGLFSESNEDYIEIDPLQQIRKAKYKLISNLRQNYLENFNDYFKGYAVNSVAWIIDVDKKHLSGNLPPNYNSHKRTLWKNDLENIEKTLVEVFQNQAVKTAYSEKNKTAIDTVINTIAPKFHAVQPLKDIFDSHKIKFNRMTQDQIETMAILEDNKHVFVEGLAGSGKSIIALEKAKKLSENNNKVLLICFNRYLINYFKENLADYTQTIKVMNLHNLIIDIKGKSPYNFSAKDQVLFLEELLNNINAFEFDHIIIDEAQDFTGGILEKLYQIANAKRGNFQLFYDKHQKHTNNDSIDWIMSKNDVVRCRLSHNCRNSIEISKTNSKLTNEKLMKSKYEVSTEFPIVYLDIDKSNLMAVLSKRIKYYQKQNVSLKNMVILSLSPYNLIEPESIPDLSVSTEWNNNSILYTTARKFKGLEADIVFIVDGNSNLFESEIDKNLFYIALSRARYISEAYLSLDLLKSKENVYELEKQYDITIKSLAKQ